ncbi:unnamed protein product [Moneuplotes crassus]|uniref:Uncharacterized protein n=1 Tax=Euplotes crassus TaxID=5936 RepID=A0AAD1XHH0_EUPCR|nr:unnamed protein product [Moneuplotes crassus]
MGRYLLSSSSSTCRTCLENSNQKWCIFKGVSNSGECCSSSSTSGYCAGDGVYVCSDDSKIDGTAGLNTNGGYILCPTYYSDCGTLTQNIYYSDQTWSTKRRSISSDAVCVYKIKSTATFIKSLTIDVNNATNADITVFTSFEDYDYEKEGSMSTGDTKAVSIEYNSEVYVVVHPTSSTNSIDIDFQVGNSESTLSAGAIVGIVMGTICCFFILMCGTVGTGVYCAIKKCRRHLGNPGTANNHAATSIQVNPSSQMNTGQAPQPLYISHNTSIVNPPRMQGDPTTDPNMAYDQNNTLQPQIGIPISGEDNRLPVIDGNPIAPVPKAKMG